MSLVISFFVVCHSGCFALISCCIYCLYQVLHFYMLRHVNGGVLDETLVAGCCSWRFWYGLWMDGWRKGWVYKGFWGGGGEEFPLSSMFCTDGTYIFASIFWSVCRDLVFTVTARKSFVFSNNSQSDLSLSLYIHFASRY